MDTEFCVQMAKFKKGMILWLYTKCMEWYGYLPTKCEPGNVVVDFEIAVPDTLKQSNAEFVFIVYQLQNLSYL